MKKIVIVCAFICSLFSLSAYEWGGLFSEYFKVNFTGKTIEDPKFRQSNSASLWVSAPIADEKLFFSGQTTYKYNFDFGSNNLFFSVFDFDLMKFSSQIEFRQSVATINFGRFYMQDNTGSIFSQKVDAVSLITNFPNCKMTLFLGYTGLLNSINDVMLGQNRIAHVQNGMFYLPAHKYLPVIFSLNFPSIFLNQQFDFETDVFFDLEQENFTRMYATIGFSGPMSSFMFYKISSTFGAENFNKFTNYSSLKTNFILSDSLLLNVNLEYASGNQLFFSEFTGFTSHTAYNSSLYPELSGVILPSVDLVFSFMDYYSAFSVKTVFDYPEIQINFKGVEVCGNLLLNIFSDLQISLSGLYYMDLLTEGAENNIAVNVNCSFTF
ncbi:MAG: hypothetical protein PUJ82_09835 [Spirochaetales bacterium]|nr:hypothetical protein [Spirochaetales bacterium]MDY5916608.1 hypothetical protein [Treponema sp.]